MFNKKLPLEDVEALDRALCADDWPVVLKYLNQLTTEIEMELINCNVTENLSYIKGKAEGARSLFKAINDLKLRFRQEYLNHE